MFQSQIRDFERIQNEIDAKNNGTPISLTQIYVEYFECAKRHDFSYMMSDSHQTWERGNAEEKHIESLIKTLIDGGVKPTFLKEKTLEVIPQRFNDVNSEGNDLTHRVIRGWFRQYEEPSNN